MRMENVDQKILSQVVAKNGDEFHPMGSKKLKKSQGVLSICGERTRSERRESLKLFRSTQQAFPVFVNGGIYQTTNQPTNQPLADFFSTKSIFKAFKTNLLKKCSTHSKINIDTQNDML